MSRRARVACLTLVSILVALSPVRGVATELADSLAKGANRSIVELRMAQGDSIVKARGGLHAEKAQLLLTWDAPYGSPRATSMHTPDCEHPGATDTLYLSLIPGRDTDLFFGFMAEIAIHPMPGDTLASLWQFDRKGANAGGLVAEFDGVADFPGRRPFRVRGTGFAKLQREPNLSMLQLVYAVPLDGPSHLDADSIYSLARLVLKHGHTLAGCDRPVCLEWLDARVTYAMKDEVLVNRGQRLVGWGPRGSDPTAPFHEAPAPKVWKPKVGASSNAPTR